MLKFRPQIAIILVITQFWTSSYNLTSKIPFLKCVEANKIILRNQWFPHFLCEVVCDVDSKRQPLFTVVNRETSHNPPFPRYTFIWMWECDSGPEKALCPCPLYPPRPQSQASYNPPRPPRLPFPYIWWENPTRSPMWSWNTLDQKPLKSLIPLPSMKYVFPCKRA